MSWRSPEVKGCAGGGFEQWRRSTACFPSDHVIDVMWCFPLLLAVTTKPSKVFLRRPTWPPTALYWRMSRVPLRTEDGDMYHVAYASSDDTAKAFSLRPGKVVQGEDKFLFVRRYLMIWS